MDDQFDEDAQTWHARQSANPQNLRKNVSFIEMSSDIQVNTPQDIFSVMFCGTQMVKIQNVGRARFCTAKNH